jgi:hypothetical protein
VALARAGGLKAEKVVGRTKTRATGTDGRPFMNPGGMPFMRADAKAAGHAWVAVQLDGEWKLLDPTWGSGHVDKGRFVRHYNDYYFLTPPERLIFTHLPEKERWQLLSTPVAAAEFDRWGEVSSTLFNYGVKTEDVQELVSAKDFKGIVEGFSHAGPRLKLLNVPLQKFLQAGKRYPLKIEAPGMVNVAVLINNNILPLVRKGPYFEGFISTPAGGEVLLVARWSLADRKLHGFLRYSVE